MPATVADPRQRSATATHPAAVDVLVDASGRLGPLSYLLPDGMQLRPGDAVTVPYGAASRHGLVLGPSATPQKASRPVLARLGVRVHENDLDLAREVARRYLCDLSAVAPRLSPHHGRDHDPLQPGPLTSTAQVPLPAPVAGPGRTLLVPPLVDETEVAAAEAARLAESGQVLVLCPTTAHVDRVLAWLPTGAVRVDSAAPGGAWPALLSGDAAVAVGTRAAALYSAHRLAGIVVVAEDHPGHQEASMPVSHARDLALMRGRHAQATVTLVTGNPSPVAVGSGLAVQEVVTGEDWPRMQLADRVTTGDYRLLPAPLVAAVSRAARAGTPALVLAERSPARRICTRCHEPRRCGTCPTDAAACEHAPAAPCGRCGGTEVRVVGWDAARIRSLFSGQVEPVTLEQLADRRDAGLVVLFSVDAALAAPSLLPHHLAAHVVLTAARAAGTGGLVVAATAQPDHPLLGDLFGNRSLLALARRTWRVARASGLPPFGRTATIQVARASAPSVAGWPGQVSGPRRAGGDWQILVRLTDADVPALAERIRALQRRGKVRFTLS